MKILLTGSTGFLGKNLVEFINKYHHDWQLITPSKSEINLLDFIETRYYIEQTKPDIVVHAAAIVGSIQQNVNSSYEFILGNMGIGTSVVDACVKTQVKQFLNISSACIYPSCIVEVLKEEYLYGINENYSLELENEGYGFGKLATFKLIQHANKTGIVNYKTLIPCNLYGEYDYFDITKGHLISAAIKKISDLKTTNSKDDIVVWGTGDAKREFLYCKDLCAIICHAIENYDDYDDVTNVGSGKEYTVLEYYRQIKDILEVNNNFMFDTTKPQGIKRRMFDLTRFNKHQINYNFHNIEDGLRKTIFWYLSNTK